MLTTITSAPANIYSDCEMLKLLNVSIKQCNLYNLSMHTCTNIPSHSKGMGCSCWNQRVAGFTGSKGS